MSGSAPADVAPNSRAPLHLFRPHTPTPRDAVVVLYRRICVLQARGEIAEAARLAGNQLPAAVAELKAAAPISDDELHALFAIEEDRAATASCVADLLLHALAERSESSKAAEPSEPLSRAARPDRREPSPAPAIPGIADFIDEMIADDRTHAGRRSA